MKNPNDVVPNHLIAVVLMASASLLAVMYLVGYRAIVDDVFYVYGANQWLINPPHLGHTHWEMRLPYVLSIAASYGLFGYGNWQTALPGIISFTLLVGATYYFFCRFVSGAAPTLIAGSVVASPIFFLNSSYITPDVLEAFFVVVSVFLFVLGCRSKKHLRTWLISSGIVAGLAMSTRFTSSGLILFYALLFLFWPHTKRPNYGYLALGFLISFGASFLLSYVESGDPLYRIHVAKTQFKPTTNFSVFVERDDMGKPPDSDEPGYSPQRKRRPPEILGPLTVGKGLRPYTSLVANHEVGLLFAFLLPSIPIVLLSRRLGRREKYPILLLGLLAVVWFVTATYILNLRPHPRYYGVTGFGAAVWVGAALYITIKARYYVVAALGVAILVSANLLSASLDGTDLHEEKRLMQIIDSHPSRTVHVFPDTFRKARFMLETYGLDQNVSTELAPSGGLFFFTPPNQYKFDPTVRPPDSWTVIEPYQRRATLVGRILKHQTLVDWVGPYIADRLSFSSPGSALYEIPKDHPAMSEEQRLHLGGIKYVLSN